MFPDFWSAVNMSTFWEFVEGILGTAAPGVMLWFAIIGVGMLLKIVVNAWKESAKKDDSEDYDYKEY